MSVWPVLVAMTAVALALLLIPLLRARGPAQREGGFDMAVYRDQMREAERDAERGTLSPDEAETAKAEIGRRLLRAADDAGVDAAAVPTRAGPRWASVIVVAIAIPAIALGIYVNVGSPQLDGQSHAERADIGAKEDGPQSGSPEDEPQSMEAAVDALAQRMRDEPHRLDGWLLLGRSYMALQRFDSAAEAYRHAVALARGRPDVSAFHGEALVAANGGTVTEEAAKAFAFALERNPFEPKSLYYTGSARAQRGDLRGAVQSWADLESISPADAPWIPAVREQIARAAAEGDFDPNSVTPVLNLAGPEDAARIRELAGRLADRLTDNPDDEQGWRILARVYRVLGEEEKAENAESMAGALAETSRLERERQGQLSRQIPPEQMARIRGMVEGLAERLTADPDDEQGWRMLARSYRVLGEPEKAAEAQAKAEALAKKDGRN
jgi:cytochrome c-type biogenesis protein CcmH